MAGISKPEPGAAGAEIATFVLHGDRFGDLSRIAESTAEGYQSCQCWSCC